MAKPTIKLETEPISPELQAKMNELESRLGGSRAQIHYDELLQGSLPGVSEAERRFRLDAFKQLGYKDLRTDKEKDDQRERDRQRESIHKLSAKQTGRKFEWQKRQ